MTQQKTRIRTAQGDKPLQLLHRHLGRDDDEIEAEFYALNPGLAAYGPVLPAGLLLTLPVITQAPAKKVVSAWD